jgi:hypothetical protein
MDLISGQLSTYCTVVIAIDLTCWGKTKLNAKKITSKIRIHHNFFSLDIGGLPFFVQ